MAEPNFEQAQNEMADDFFADKNGVIDDVSTSDGQNATGENEVSEVLNPEERRPEKKQPENKPEQTVEGQQQTQQPEKKDDDKKDEGIDPGSAEAVMLFDKDDKGNMVFNVEKALETFKPDEKAFGPDVKDPKEQAGKTQQEKPLTPEEEIQKRLDQRLETHKLMVKNLMSYKDFLSEALQQGYEGIQAMSYADRKIEDMVRSQIERQRLEEDAKAQIESERRLREREELAQKRPRAEHIIGTLNRELGGVFDQLTIGYQDKNGKVVPGHASKDLNMLFAMMNPGAFDKPAQLQKAYEDWWLNIVSNEKSARWVANLGRLRLMEKSLPKILEEQRAASSAQGRRLSEGKNRSPSNINHQTGSGQQDSIAEWLKAEPGKKVDIVG